MSRKNIPPASTTAHKPDHHLDWDIGCLRKLIHQAATKNRNNLNLEDQTGPMETNDTPPALSRLLEVRRDLAGRGLDPADRLRHALNKLEVEWVEFKKLRA
ncbi:MAG: hypothetical protein AAGU17_11040 [Anaerolineaceae bacterium]